MDLVARAKGLILDPQAEWRAIAGERTGPAFLLARYVAIVAVIPALCGLIGSLILGSPIVPSLRTTRWQGTISAVGLAPQALATARTAAGWPISRAISA